MELFQLTAAEHFWFRTLYKFVLLLPQYIGSVQGPSSCCTAGQHFHSKKFSSFLLDFSFEGCAFSLTSHAKPLHGGTHLFKLADICCLPIDIHQHSLCLQERSWTNKPLWTSSNKLSKLHRPSYRYRTRFKIASRCFPVRQGFLLSAKVAAAASEGEADACEQVKSEGSAGWLLFSIESSFLTSNCASHCISCSTAAIVLNMLLHFFFFFSPSLWLLRKTSRWFISLINIHL